jgi:hypothetical protein
VRLRDVPEGSRVELADGRRGRRGERLQTAILVSLEDAGPREGPLALDPATDVKVLEAAQQAPRKRR